MPGTQSQVSSSRQLGHDVPSLDGIRAIAITMVLLRHAQLSQFPEMPSWLADGAMGVRIFFVLSGFLITLVMLREESRRGKISLAGFYRRRFVRILPVYWTFLAAVSLLWLVGILHLRPTDILRPLTFTFAIGLDKTRHWITLHIYTLVIEEHFYLVWPVAFLLLATRRRRLVALSAVLILVPLFRLWLYSHPTKIWLTITIFAQADMLGWGCMLAILWHSSHAMIQSIVKWRPAIGRIAALAVIHWSTPYLTLALGRDPSRGLPIAMSVQAAAIAYLIASLVEVDGVLRRTLNSRPVIWLGVLSYSLYIWQQMFLGNASGQWRWWERPPQNLLCVFVVASCSYYFVERPLFRFKRPAAPAPVPQMDPLPSRPGNAATQVGAPMMPHVN